MGTDPMVEMWEEAWPEGMLELLLIVLGLTDKYEHEYFHPIGWHDKLMNLVQGGHEYAPGRYIWFSDTTGFFAVGSKDDMEKDMAGE